MVTRQNIGQGERVSNGSGSDIGREGREKLIIVGDSMPRGVERYVKLKERGSCIKSIGGAGIKQIMREAAVKAEEAEPNSKMFICGGGNSLKL